MADDQKNISSNLQSSFTVASQSSVAADGQSEDSMNLFEELGLELLPKKEKLRLLEKLEFAAREQIINLILEQMEEKDYQDFDELLNKKEAQEGEVLFFLQQRIPNLEVQIAQRMQDFKKQLVEQVKNIRQDIQKMQAQQKASGEGNGDNMQKQIEVLQEELDQAMKDGDFKKVPILTQKIHDLKEG